MTNTELQAMHIDEFESAVDRWGASLDDWPPDDGLRARALLSGTASEHDKRAAQAALDAATALENLFAHTDPHTTSPGLADRIQANVGNNVGANDGLLKLVDWFRAALWRPTIALAAPISLGFLIGLTVPLETVDPGDDGLQEELSWIAFTTDYEETGNGADTEFGDQP